MKNARLLLFILLLAAMPVVSLAQGGKAADVKASVIRRVVAPEALVMENMPPVPMEIAEATKKYTEAIPVGGGSWHPVRREMLAGKRAGNVNQVHLLKTPLGEVKQLTNFPDPVGGGSWQPTMGKYFVFFKASGGNEIAQLHRYDVETDTITRLTTNDRMRIGGGPWTTAGDRYLYTSVPTGGGTSSDTIKTEFYTIDPANPDSAKLLVALDGVGWGAIDFSPDDKKLLIAKYVSANESYIYLYDIATGEKTLLTPQEGAEKVAWNVGGFRKDGKAIYVVTDKGSEFQRLFLMDLATRNLTPLTSHINWDVSGGELSEDGKWLAFTTNENGWSKLHVLDTATNKEIKLPKLPAGQVGGIRWHKKTGELGMNITSFTSLTDAYSLDLKSDKLTHWAKTELNGYETKGLREPELIKWKSFDGLEISGFMYKPPTTFKGKRPVIINIHG
ncbi:MAG: S9 family peptidase, partial [Pyrinomonadaceae bacterium]